MDLFQLRLMLGVTLCFYSTAQMIERDQAILILKNIFDKIDIVLVKLEGQEEQLTSLEESQKTIRENMEGQNEKLANLEESQKTIRENMEGQNEKLASLEEAKDDFHGTRMDLATLQHLLDTDECTEQSHNCPTDAHCTDTFVSFRCNCNPGFSGNGYTCTDIDECQDEEDRCDPHSTCTNAPGKYSCDCHPGFRANGTSCVEIDECVEEIHKCHKYAVCENTVGNYTCHCTLYHEGDGSDCKAVAGCDSPFKDVPGVGCLHIIERMQSWDASRESCKEMGADLFVAINPEHYQRLTKHFFYTNQAAIKKYMYVGVKEGVWLNGRKVSPKEEAPRNPSMGNGTCSYTDGDTSEKFLLWTHPCRETWWALCQRNV